MQVRYDKDIDAVYLYLNDDDISESKVARSEEILPGIISDFDESSNVLGIEILHVRGRTREQLKQIDSLLTKEQIDKFRQLYRQLPA